MIFLFYHLLLVHVMTACMEMRLTHLYEAIVHVQLVSNARLAGTVHVTGNYGLINC